MRRSGVRIPLPPVYARSGSGERRLSRRNFSGGGPLCLITSTQRATTRRATFFNYARSVAKNVDCRAVALAKADLFNLVISTQRASTRHAIYEMGSFTYVYILQSETDAKRFYTGCARDLPNSLVRPI